jgi:hypothetical protein
MNSPRFKGLRHGISRRSRRLASLGAALLLAGAAAGADDPLAAGFAHPPVAAQPRTWWHWVSGNVSREGITADLEAMKSIGLAGAQLFTVDQSEVKGPVVFMSPEWRQLVQHAVSESKRLGLELSIEDGEGWSESGGPWVAPAQSMQKVVWTEAQFLGGSTIPLSSIYQPLAVRGYYEDIAIFAFPTVRGDLPAGIPKIWAPAGKGKPPIWLLGPPVSVPIPAPTQPQSVVFEYPTAQAFRSFRVETAEPLRDNPPTAAQWELQVSDDGHDYRKVCNVGTHGTTTFPEVSGRFFRFWLPVLPPRAAELVFTQLELAGVRLDKPEAHAGMAVDRSVNRFSNLSDDRDAIPAASVVDLTGKTEWAAPAGHWTIVRIGHTSTGITNHPASPATVGLEADKLSRAAMTAHLEGGSMGAVIRDSGPLVGDSLQYILCDSWEAGCENWTPLIRTDFRQRRGYDLQPWLLTLTGRIVGSTEATERFLWDFRRTLADLVAENHYGTMQDYAHRNHLGLYAEAVGINMPTVADQLQCKGRTDIPMGEFWVGQYWAGQTPIDDTKEAASAAHIYGQNIAAAEAYTARAEFGSWAQDPYALKALGDLELCLGINRFVFHRYAHQPWLDRQPGMSMGPWGTNFERTNTWWEPAAAWMSYLSRCQFLLQQGRFAADVCYFYGESAPVDLKADDLRPLLPRGFDYDACDAELLLRLRVQEGRVVLPSGMSYRVLVLPASDRMTVPVLQKIRELVNAGATVVGPRPNRSPSLTNFSTADRDIRSLAAQVWGDCDGVGVTEHRLGAGRVVWGRPLAETLGVPPDFWSADENLRFIHRTDGEAEIYFVSNQEARELVANCAFRVTGKIPELWHPDTGKQETLAAYQVKGGQTVLPLHLDPVGSVFVIFRRPAAGTDPIVRARTMGEAFGSQEAGAGTPLIEPPVFREGQVVLTEWQGAGYSLTTASGRTLAVPAADLPAPLAIDGSWQVAFPPKLGAPPRATLDHLVSWTDSNDDGVKFFSGTAAYAKDFELTDAFFGPGKRQFLDLGSVKNLARVRLNGRDLGVLWKEPFRVEVTGAARAGRNDLEVQITNLWPNRMIGDAYLPPAQRITWASVEPYGKGSPLLPSGLLGPVVVRAAADVEARPDPATP